MSPIHQKPGEKPPPGADKRPQPPAPSPVGPSLDDRIRARAYQLFRQRTNNAHSGDALSDWLQAERELDGNAQDPPDPTDPPDPLASADPQPKPVTAIERPLSRPR
ncbi:MAG: DUF2934 domain-containing protein [Phycisphaerales bacterium]|nr:DUF2934 domain-containing protein [Phycisphaerales bacterium]